MSRVGIQVIGAESAVEARAIAGTDTSFYHPIGRYVTNPRHPNALATEPKTLLPNTVAAVLSHVTLAPSHPLRNDRVTCLFNDQWLGTTHDVTAIVSDPGDFTPPQPDLHPSSYRYCLLTHLLVNGAVQNVLNEVLLQHHDDSTWQTVAGVAETSVSGLQRDYVHPDLAETLSRADRQAFLIAMTWNLLTELID